MFQEDCLLNYVLRVTYGAKNLTAVSLLNLVIFVQCSRTLFPLLQFIKLQNVFTNFLIPNKHSGFYNISATSTD